jgi:hypothetical protein
VTTRRSLRTFSPAHLSAHHPSVSIPTRLDAFQLLSTDAFQLHPDVASYGTNDPGTELFSTSETLVDLSEAASVGMREPLAQSVPISRS